MPYEYCSFLTAFFLPKNSPDPHFCLLIYHRLLPIFHFQQYAPYAVNLCLSGPEGCGDTKKF